MSDKEKQRWSNIGKCAWELARDAFNKEKEGYEFTASPTGPNDPKKKGDAFDYIWDHVHDYGFNEYETGVLGEWACDNYEKLKEERT